MSELAPINEKETSLFRLKSELVELMNLRENEELSTEEREAVDGQIKAYIGAELRKVDNVASFIRHRRAMAKAAKDEAQRLAKLAASYEAEEEYVLGMCKDLMIQFGERKLEGERGSISLQKNGGNQALDVDLRLLPPEFSLTVMTISSVDYDRIWQYLIDQKVTIPAKDVVPNTAKIREALKQGPVAGARLQERGEHVRVR